MLPQTLVVAVNVLATIGIWYLFNVLKLPQIHVNATDITICTTLFRAVENVISKEQIQLSKELGGLGVC